jgi:hypothetical protein
MLITYYKFMRRETWKHYVTNVPKHGSRIVETIEVSNLLQMNVSQDEHSFMF